MILLTWFGSTKIFTVLEAVFLLKIGPQKCSEHHKNLCRERGFFCTSYPLVDWVVQGGWRQWLEVELPHGHAGIHSVVVEYTVYCYVLPGSSHHFLGDVAHRCTQERKKNTSFYVMFTASKKKSHF